MANGIELRPGKCAEKASPIIVGLTALIRMPRGSSIAAESTKLCSAPLITPPPVTPGQASSAKMPDVRVNEALVARALFEAGVVADADAGELGQLFPA